MINWPLVILVQALITILVVWITTVISKPKPIKVEIVCGEQVATSYLTPIDNTIRINLDIEQ